MASKPFHAFRALTCAVLAAQLAGCGTIMYPHRRGQQGGKIDAGVAVLDGVGLLFFLVPGIIAFAVDFSTGAIYLPGTSRSSSGPKELQVVEFDTRHCTNGTLERIIRRETGYAFKFNQASIRITRLRSGHDTKADVAKAFSMYGE